MVVYVVRHAGADTVLFIGSEALGVSPRFGGVGSLVRVSALLVTYGQLHVWLLFVVGSPLHDGLNALQSPLSDWHEQVVWVGNIGQDRILGGQRSV